MDMLVPFDVASRSDDIDVPKDKVLGILEDVRSHTGGTETSTWSGAASNALRSQARFPKIDS